MIRSSPVVKDKDSNVEAMYDVGKLKFESPSNLNFTWEIANYLSLTQQQDLYFVSHAFNFLNAKWKLFISPNGFTLHKSSGCIVAVLSKIKGHPCTPSHRVSFKVSINRKDGKEFVSRTFKRNFVENSSHGGSLVQRAQLLENEADIMQNGNLTLIWVLEAEKKETYLTDAQDSKDVFFHTMKEMFHQSFFCDLIIEVKDKKFNSHKAILGARSPVFYAMLTNDMTEKKSGVIEIKDCEPNAFSEFLLYLYSGDTENLTIENICDVYTLADKYDVQQLKSECVAIMSHEISIDNFCAIMSLALKHEESELIKKGTDFFIDNVKNILLSVQWQYFIAENPTVANELFLKTVDGDNVKRRRL